MSIEEGGRRRERTDRKNRGRRKRMKIKDGEIENETGRRKRIQIKYLYINKLHDIKMEHEKINTQKGRKVERYKAGRIGEEENKKNGWRY